MSTVGDFIQPGGPCWKCGLTVGDIVDRGAGAYADGRLRFMHAGGECPTVDTLPPELKRRLAVPGPQQADASPLLDLVGQYGDKRVEAVSVEECGGDGEPYEREAAVLLARIAALVPQQPVQARDETGRLLWIHTCGFSTEAESSPLACGYCEQAPGPWRPLLVAGDPAPSSAVESVYCEGCGVDNCEQHIAPKPDPLKLSLPEVPEGTEALIGGESGFRYVVLPGSVLLFKREGDQEWIGDLSQVLGEEVTVRVELAPPREPRTWPKLDGAPEGLKTFIGESGRVYHRVQSGLFAMHPDFYREGKDHRAESLSHWAEVDGPLTEVTE